MKTRIIKYMIGEKFKIYMFPQTLRSQCEICKSAKSGGHLIDYINYKIIKMCFNCVDEYNLGSEREPKRKAGLSIMKMKKLI